MYVKSFDKINSAVKIPQQRDIELASCTAGAQLVFFASKRWPEFLAAKNPRSP
jgi:hypothetical protein